MKLPQIRVVEVSEEGGKGKGKGEGLKVYQIER